MKLLGGHVSISGGVHNAPARAREATCDCMQIFSKNQMQWRAKPLDLEEAELLKKNMKEHRIEEAVIHDSYLINLASPDEALLKRSKEAFLDEVVRAKHLGVRSLIFHPGAHMGAGERTGLRRVAESLNWVRREAGNADVRFVLENTAGQGTVLGHSFEHLAEIMDMLDDRKRVGVCFDTCHAYAAGHDVRSKAGYERVFERFDAVLGLRMLKAMHLNDCKGKMGSHLDRHEQIGDGLLGLECFRVFMNDDRWDGVPMILETPKGEDGYKDELKLLRSVVRR